MTDEQQQPGNPHHASRRGFLGAAAAGAGVLVAGGAVGYGVGRASADTPNESGPASANVSIPFYGPRQAGISTPAQDRLAFAAFDVTTTDVLKLQAMLGTWAAAASRMVLGELIGPTETAPQAPPVDTGEALGLGPAKLTITVGFGPSLFDGRFGLAGKRPAALADIPGFRGDQINPDISNGDICVQACSDDPQVAFHVIRNFARLARGAAVIRWSQLGFGRTSSTSTSQQTPRNLMGFKDGTNNIKAEDEAEMNSFVWVGDETDQSWMKGGSYVVSRRIRMLIETWDSDYIADQESIFGRTKDSGAPLTGKDEFDKVDLAAKDSKGDPVIAADSHIRLAAPATNGGLKILRRGYSYTDGIDQQSGLLDAGLFFLAYQRDPRKQFVPIQRRLGQSDGLNEYIRHTSSGVFAVPPGLSGPGDWFGKALFQ
ncbi:deferrochelatase/peroxidase EfeB [Jatrophihabitans sp. GAS493]|uniref:iron uptake transporter deferrochelatase/peroxidase subunit n=1 Tax=Jatrophihabitans sp. GAS493 TaxID=1907575 RepID=UPI000BB67BE4|nr:iron uptake transporter deferrochelatase/peroxidase subunit [Jatrophihabitans sp. GAS493]SOD72689.1 deferrochelatase/peroxidase EfeB [Jatrophihabitans sp. GAS493]